MAQHPLPPLQTSAEKPKQHWIRLQASIVCPLCNMEQVISTGVDARARELPPNTLEMTRFAFNQHLRAKHANEDAYPAMHIQP